MNVENPVHIAYLVGGVLAVMILWPLVSAGVEAVSPVYRLKVATKPMPPRVRARWREILSPTPTSEVHAAWSRLGIRTANRYPTVVTACHRRRGLTRFTKTKRFVTCALVIRPALATSSAWGSEGVRRELAAALGVGRVWTHVIGTDLPAGSPWWMSSEFADTRPARRFRLRYPASIPAWPSLTPRPGDVVIRWDLPKEALKR